MEQNKISVIVPCYNSEKFLHRLLDSLLKQTYQNMQIIIVNDGSTDDTYLILQKYKYKFKKRNIEFNILHQSNQGQAAAVNLALPLVTGEYLIWADSDDYYELDAFEKLVSELQKDSTLMYVRGKALYRDEVTLSIVKIGEPKDKKKENLFLDYIFKSQNVYCFSGIIMVRSEYFFDTNRGRKIYNSVGGQNWQLILPVVYHGKGKYIDESIYNCLVRKNSHSRSSNGYKKQVKRKKDLERILLSTIRKLRMPVLEKSTLLLKIRITYFKDILSIKLENKIFPYTILKIFKHTSNKNQEFVIDKKLCNGCGSCASSCPFSAIDMVEDFEGFKYPKIDKTKCKHCNICQKKCPVLKKGSLKTINSTYIAYNKNETIRMKSSSGGIFYLLAREIIKMDGVIFGAILDSNNKVRHNFYTKIDGIEKIMGSKYVQSDLNSTFKDVKNFLDSGRVVLFTGTPCQIAGLIIFLKKDYKNLYTQDIVCHGVPSHKVLEKYIDSFNFNSKIEKINFKDKRTGWKNYSITFTTKTNVQSISNLKDKYMRMFIKNKCLRYSCYNCSFKGNNKYSDITLGDCWGIEKIFKDMDDDKGISLIIIHSEKGKELFNFIKKDIKYKIIDINDALIYNTAYKESPKMPRSRETFYYDLYNLSFDKLYMRQFKKDNILKRMIRKVKKLIFK